MATVEDIVANHRDREGPLLPILHDVQAEFGYISEAAMVIIATGLNLTRAEVFGVVSFYKDFLLKAESRPVMKLCRAEACQARGVEALIEDIKAFADLQIKLEPVYCLGLCSVGPAALTADGKVHARLDKDKIKVLIEDQK